MENHENRSRSSLGALALNQQMTVRIPQNQRTLILGRFKCLSFVAAVVGRVSFKDYKWLTITLAWKGLCCPGTL